jgi:hypothetical protein
MIKKENKKMPIEIQKKVCNHCGKTNEWVKRKPVKCKFCDILYWEKPVNEIKLFVLQDEYLKSRDSNVLGKMALIIYEIARNIIIKKLKNSRKIQQEDIEDKTSDTVEKLLSYYLKKPNFSISDSFTGYIDQVVLYPLYNKKTKELEQNEISMESILENVNHSNNNNINSETIDLKFNVSGSAEYTEHEINYKKEWNDHSDNFSLNSLYKYSSDEYILDYANIDFFINDITKAIECILNLVLKKFGLKEALVQSLFFYHFFAKTNKNFYNRLADQFGDESNSRFRYIVENFSQSFKEFEKKILMLRNVLYKDLS